MKKSFTRIIERSRSREQLQQDEIRKSIQARANRVEEQKKSNSSKYTNQEGILGLDDIEI